MEQRTTLGARKGFQCRVILHIAAWKIFVANQIAESGLRIYISEYPQSRNRQ